MKINSKHINDVPQDQLRPLCKQYYVRARTAEKERDTLKSSVEALKRQLSYVTESVQDTLKLLEDI